MLICPLGQTALLTSPSGVQCSNRHSFDRARQGYLNLLPVQHKASRAPGDNAEMVQARRDFLSAGYYQPVADFLCRHAISVELDSWLDIGCGEGYYTAQVATALGSSPAYALDISKEAVRQACRRSNSVEWMVASMARVPLAEASMDALFSVFSPLDWGEVLRLLSPRGRLLHLAPGQDHLIELREMIYDEVRAYDDGKHVSSLPDGLTVLQTDYLNYKLCLDDERARHDLLLMTPHGQRSNEQKRSRVLHSLDTVTVSVRLDTIIRSNEVTDAA
ncbi:MAG: methyltransferase domain-containing protein [Thiopseudomonas sp.]